MIFDTPSYILGTKAGGGGGGDITTEALNATANGRYIAPSGIAYTPVNVNVPIPPNYGLITWNGSFLTVS